MELFWDAKLEAHGYTNGEESEETKCVFFRL
jgi:hypothetical protein